MTDWIEYFRVAARGLPITHVWRGHGSALFIELGAITQRHHSDGTPGEPEGEIGLMIEWSWRIEDKQSIACGSCSSEHLWALAFTRLVGVTVHDLATFGRLPEVMLTLADDQHVSSFMTAEGDPAWTLFDRRGGCQLAVSCRDGVIAAEA